MSTIKTTNLQHPSAASPAIVLDADGGATVAGMGLVLVSPTSIANSGGSASASGGEVSFTGVSSVSLNGVFTSEYENYRIVMSAFGSTGLDVSARVRASGTDLSGSVYQIVTLRCTGTSALVGSNTGSTSVVLTPVRAAGYGTNIFDIVKPFAASYTNFTGEGADAINELFFWKATVTNTTSYDGITIYPLSGNITGTIRVYGYKNS